MTKRDLELHRTEMMRDLAELGHERTVEIAATRHEVGAMGARLTRTFTGWLFASQAAVIGAMAVLLAIA